MRISDWSSDVCSSDLTYRWFDGHGNKLGHKGGPSLIGKCHSFLAQRPSASIKIVQRTGFVALTAFRSEEHTSELQSLMRISYAVFCLKKKKSTIISVQDILIS